MASRCQCVVILDKSCFLPPSVGHPSIFNSQPKEDSQELSGSYTNTIPAMVSCQMDTVSMRGN